MQWGWGKALGPKWAFGVFLGALVLSAPGCRFVPEEQALEPSLSMTIEDGATVDPGGVIGDGGLYQSLERIYGMQTQACYNTLLRGDRPGQETVSNVQAEVRSACPGIGFSPWHVPALGEPRRFPLASGWSLVLIQVDPVAFAGELFAGVQATYSTEFPMFVLFMFPDSQVELRIRAILGPRRASEKENSNRHTYTVNCPLVSSGVFNREGAEDPACLVTPSAEYITPRESGGETTPPREPPGQTIKK